ncbi:hypothetical protein NDU88_003460 [Pleurodeles waltl]|uniref:Uncharacterized protein n=1 Tax=Pleurodeles waltl TaxID=8319 RepID=A0AAV7MRW5_PLEWA|nr:hypothetical protein NDU88_003460 [Pleurodeles waltl]
MLRQRADSAWQAAGQSSEATSEEKWLRSRCGCSPAKRGRGRSQAAAEVGRSEEGAEEPSAGIRRDWAVHVETCWCKELKVFQAAVTVCAGERRSLILLGRGSSGKWRTGKAIGLCIDGQWM